MISDYDRKNLSNEEFLQKLEDERRKNFEAYQKKLDKWEDEIRNNKHLTNPEKHLQYIADIRKEEMDAFARKIQF